MSPRGQENVDDIVVNGDTVNIDGVVLITSFPVSYALELGTFKTDLTVVQAPECHLDRFFSTLQEVKGPVSQRGSRKREPIRVMEGNNNDA
jgi:hypothetical protein